MIQGFNQFATVVLSALLTDYPRAPVVAMGYSGFNNDTRRKLTSIYHKVDQTNYLVDHDAMLIPSSEMIEKIYKEKLFKGNPESFSLFGKWLS